MGEIEKLFGIGANLAEVGGLKIEIQEISWIDFDNAWLLPDPREASKEQKTQELLVNLISKLTKFSAAQINGMSAANFHELCAACVEANQGFFVQAPKQTKRMAKALGRA